MKLSRALVCASLLAVSARADFVVSNTNDSGAGSLRQAIINANATAGSDVIGFTIPAGSIINVLSQLPPITEGLVMNPTGTRFVINGSGAGAGAHGLILRGGNVTVSHMVIQAFSGRGISIEGGGGNSIDDCYIGTNAAGNAAVGNGTGIFISESSGNNIGYISLGVSENTISGNAEGIRIDGASSTNNRIINNRIGTNAAGTAAVPNTLSGIIITNAPDNVIEENLISGNVRNGIALSGASATGNRISKNKIGTDISGNVTGMGNQINGIILTSGASSNEIGDGWGNIVSGNFVDGIRLDSATTTGNRVLKNTIRQNGLNGIVISDAPGNEIGFQSQGNVIQLNGTNGIGITGAGAVGNYIVDNTIGGASAGNLQHGIAITGGASGNSIGLSGGFDPSSYPNSIIGNGGDGIWIDTVNANVLTYNTIHSNGGLGIDLAPNGVTPNDAGDTDTGAHGLQNFPILTSVVSSPTDTTFRGTLNSTPNTTFKILFFYSTTCDASGSGEAEDFINASSWVATNGSGNATFEIDFGGSATIGRQATAVVEGAQGFSEMSACRVISACSASISPASVSAPAAGASGSVDVTSSPGCPWTAVSNAGWITVTSASENGSGSVNYSVAANTGPARSGTITIAGKTFTVNQASGCTYSINPTSQSIVAAGASGSVAVTTVAGCTWTGVSNDAWITVTSGATGTGNGSVGYSVAATTGPARTGTITIAGKTFTVNQASGCVFSLTPASASAAAAGGTGSFNVSSATGCAWTAVRNDTWITVTSGATGSGNGSVGYSVAANTGPARSGTITAGGKTFTVNQANGCVYAISPTSASVPAAGTTTGSINVTSGNGCPWTATSNAGWITVTSGTPGSGNASVGYSVAANTGPARSGTITVAGKTYTVNQANGCTYSLSPTSAGAVANASTGSFAINTVAGCAWSATSNAAWITVTGVASGTGSSTISYSVASNSDIARSGTITAGGATFTINQDARALLSMSSSTYAAGEGAGSVTVRVNRTRSTVGVSSVNYATTSGTAASPGDFTAKSGTLTFANGETFKDVSITIIGDSLDEVNEQFSFTISAPSNGVIVTSQSTITITDDDGPAISIADYSVVEGDSGTVDALFVVTLSAASPQQVSVNYATSNGSAVTPADYAALSGSLSFTSGQTSKSVTVVVSGDAANEIDEQFFVTLSAAVNATIADAQATGTIVDDDGTAVVNVTAISPSSGLASGTAVTISGSSFQPGATATIGGIDAAGAYQSSTVIGATTGSLTPGTLNDVVVSNPGGESGVLEAGFFADFLDVPQSHIFRPFVQKLVEHSITAGCGGGRFCVNDPVTRGQMAVFLLVGKHGAGFVPPPATGTIFSDVPAGAPFAAWIEELYNEGITAGCAVSPLRYCSTSPVSRGEMAVFLLVAKYGNVTHPPATGTVFGDVPVSHPFAKWIEKLAADGVTSGCGGGNYCPAAAVTRGEMAVFLVANFGL